MADVRSALAQQVDKLSNNRFTSSGRKNLGGLACANKGAPTINGAKFRFNILR